MALGKTHSAMVKVLIALAIFFAGFTLGQGHGVFDFNGDGTVGKADFTQVMDNLFKRS